MASSVGTGACAEAIWLEPKINPTRHTRGVNDLRMTQLWHRYQCLGSNSNQT